MTAKWEVRQGDALEELAKLPPFSVACVIADPPYGINTKSDGDGKLNPWADLCNAAHWYRSWLGLCRRALRPDGSLWSFLNWRSMVTFQKAACDLGWPIESLAVWDKSWIGPGGHAGLRPRYEMVALWAMPDFAIRNRGIPDIFTAKSSAHKPNGHPAEKPEQAIAWILDASEPKGLVVDPFCGSGTTGAVCASRGIDFLGFEIDERFVTASRTRIDNATKQAPLFEKTDEAGAA